MRTATSSKHSKFLFACTENKMIRFTLYSENKTKQGWYRLGKVGNFDRTFLLKFKLKSSPFDGGRKEVIIDYFPMFNSYVLLVRILVQTFVLGKLKINKKIL